MIDGPTTTRASRADQRRQPDPSRQESAGQPAAETHGDQSGFVRHRSARQGGATCSANGRRVTRVDIVFTRYSEVVDGQLDTTTVGDATPSQAAVPDSSVTD
jgi:hypothetical protein